MNYHPSLTLRHTSLTLALPLSRKTLQLASTHMHKLPSLPRSFLPSIRPSSLVAVPFPPYFSAPPCSEWASLLLPLASSLSTVKDFKAKVRWSLTVTNRGNLLLSLPSASGPRPLGVKADIHAGRTLTK